jgi:hypothetical protein
MFKARRRIIVFASNICIGFICVFLTLFLVPEASFGISVGIAGVIFTVLLLVSVNLADNAIERVQNKILLSHETGILTKFTVLFCQKELQTKLRKNLQIFCIHYGQKIILLQMKTEFPKKNRFLLL